MESELSPDKCQSTPPVPIKTYQWEDVRRAREAGGYPWTHLLKVPLEGEITAEDILRETTPRRSMSREFSRSRTHSPVDRDTQRILNLDASPGSSRKYGEEGDDEGVHIPNFSKEVSLDSEDDAIDQAVQAYVANRPESQSSTHLASPVEIPKNVSPKSILKRRAPEQHYNIGVTETREKTKCCHPLVNKIKHLADKTLHKLERSDNEKSPITKRKKNEDTQEIRQLKSSPGAVRRQKFSAIKLGDSDEMSKSMSVESPPIRKKKEHIYEDIDEKSAEKEKILQFAPNIHEGKNEVKEENCSQYKQDNESLSEKKSNASQDPSLVTDEATPLSREDHVMEILHKKDDINKEAVLLDDDTDEPNVDEIFQNQLDEVRPKNDSPNITITEIVDDDAEATEDCTAVPIETSPTPSPLGIERKDRKDASSDWSKPNSKLRRWTSEGGTPIEKAVRPTREGSVQVFTPDVRCACQFYQCDSLLPERVNPVGTRPTSRTSNIISFVSDHEYEIIEKPPSNIVYHAPNVGDRTTMVKADDELSSTTSLERKYLQHASDEDEQMDDKENLQNNKNDDTINAEALQKDIEDRFFVNTPSTISRTECEVSTSQVDSSALENLPLKRGSRPKNTDSHDSKLQQRIKEGTGKLKNQAGKLKTKLQNMKTSMPERPKISFPERAKFKMPERPKISFPERPKFSLPDRRKFSLPDRPKFKKINISEKLNLGDRKKFTLPERPKFNVPDLSKFKMPERPKINFPSLGKKKEYKVDTTESESATDVKNVSSVEFEAKTFPRLFGRKKKRAELQKTSSSPTLEREDTPPPNFTFTRMKKATQAPSSYIPDSPKQPREYGNIDNVNNYDDEFGRRKQFETTYDFDKIHTDYLDETPHFGDNLNASSIPNLSPSKQEYTHVINEIDNDEFFVRPRGISRENIQVREYLSDEIRQAFKIPKNVLASMGSNSMVDDKNVYINEPEADPELTMDYNEPIRYSNEDLNDRDDGYYTFPPVRPSRGKRKKKEPEPEPEPQRIPYIDDNMNASLQFSEVDLGLNEDHEMEGYVVGGSGQISEGTKLNFSPPIDSGMIHEYANDDILEYPENVPIQSQTLPMPPKRKRKIGSKDLRHSSLSDFKDLSTTAWQESQEPLEDIIVYRTEHEYILPQAETITVTDQSPVPPRRNRSRSSRGTSLCDDDRTSHGAESLTLDTHGVQPDEIDIEREIRHESPGYATVDKGSYVPNKKERRSKNKTPPVRHRKSHSSERKYYTVGSATTAIPDRPPRKKSSTSLMTLESSTKRSVSGDLTQYVEIDEPHVEEVHKDLQSGEVVSKMKDRPLPPPPRPPRGSRKSKKDKDASDEPEQNFIIETESKIEISTSYPAEEDKGRIVEIEVSTQTDPLPDDVDFELGMDENLDVSVSSSLRDIIDEDSIVGKSNSKIIESPRFSRPTSRSEKSLKLSDPKISELSKSTIGRTSPTVILVERRVSSPTRINERDEMLTEASLTVLHIDVEESQIPEVPPLPMSRGVSSDRKSTKNMAPPFEERALERVTGVSSTRDVQLDNLATQRLQVRDLDVDRLNVSELQASKILVSDIEGMTLQVSELDSKSGHISVSGIEFSQTVIDEIVKKFAEITTTQAAAHTHDLIPPQRPISREEQTQTEEYQLQTKSQELVLEEAEPLRACQQQEQTAEIQSLQPPKFEEHLSTQPSNAEEKKTAPPPPPRPPVVEDTTVPPQRPPPPDLTPLLYSYLQDLSLPPPSLYVNRGLSERPFTEFHESQHQTPPPPTRRIKRKPAAHHSESSSDEDRTHPSPRRMPPPVRSHEPTIVEAGAQFLRVCHNSVSRTIRHIFNSLMSYISGAEDKKDVQMALVIFLVLIAGLIMFGLSDSRTVHHHHWEFFNPPDNTQ